MKKIILSFILAVVLLVSFAGPAARAVTLNVDDAQVIEPVYLIDSTTYVPLRTVSLLLCPGAVVSWENGQAIVSASNLILTATPRNCYLEANGRMLYIEDGVKLIDGSTLVPVRVLAEALGAAVYWDADTCAVTVESGSGVILSGDDYYDSDSVYWLSRVIEAESGGETLDGKIAVGNVILNRAASSDYPDSIYEVIFDDNWGIQFEVVSNLTIYNTPSVESIIAAKLCLDGASVVGSCMYFLNPGISTSFWIAENCTYITTIGNHQFYA